MRQLFVASIAVLTLAVAAPARAGDQYEGKLDADALKYLIRSALKTMSVANAAPDQNYKFGSGTIAVNFTSGKLATKSVELKPTQDAHGENSRVFVSGVFTSPQGTVKIIKANSDDASFDAQVSLVRLTQKHDDFAVIDTVGKHFPGGAPKDGGLTFKGRSKADYDNVNKSKVTDDLFMFVITLSPEVATSAGAQAHKAVAQFTITGP